MGFFRGPNIIKSNLAICVDAGNTKSFVGEPTTNYAINWDPWTVNGENTNVTGTMDVPISTSKTWKFQKFGTSDQWNGWESTYGGIWTGSAGDIWTTSYWYKTLSPAGLSSFSIGAFYLSNWSRPYSTSTIANYNSIIADGLWHYNYTTVQINEDYSSAVIVDGPSWSYSTQAGLLYINGLQWEKKSYPTPYSTGTRGATVATGGGLRDLTNNGYNGDLTYMTFDSSGMDYNGSSSYITLSGNGTSLNSQYFTIDVWAKFDDLGADHVLFSYDYATHVNPYYSAHLRISDPSVIYFMWNDGSTYQYLNKTSAPLGTTTYHNIVAIYAPGDQRLYVDGVLVNSSTRNDTITFYGTPVWLGKGNYGGYHNGRIGNVKYYKRALSGSEVVQNYNALKTRFGS